MRSILFFLLALPVLAGETWVLPNGTTYTEVQVSRQDPHRVTIVHSTGVARLSYTELPPELLARFGKNQSQAEAALESEKQEKTKAALEAERAAKIAKATKIVYKGEVVGRHEKGWILDSYRDHSNSPPINYGYGSLASQGGGRVARPEKASDEIPTVMGFVVLVDYPASEKLEIGQRIRLKGYFDGKIEINAKNAQFLYYLGPPPPLP